MRPRRQAVLVPYKAVVERNGSDKQPTDEHAERDPPSWVSSNRLARRQRDAEFRSTASGGLNAKFYNRYARNKSAERREHPEIISRYRLEFIGIGNDEMASNGKENVYPK